MTAMDFRQYDQALGRFNVMDALSEMAYDQTPYRYGFNNPVFWKDPSGLFETYAKAAKFISDNGINGSIELLVDGDPTQGYTVRVIGGEFDGDVFYDHSSPLVFSNKASGGANSGKSSESGIDWAGIGRTAADFTPILGGCLDCYEGYQNGDGLQIAMGVVSLIADGVTLGGSSLLKGTIKTGIKQGSKQLAKKAAKEAAKEVTKTGKNLVYQGIDKAGVVRYVGITKREANVRFAEHLNSGTAKSLLQYRVVDGATGLSRTSARVLEQTLINQHGLSKNGGQLLNRINSIAPNNWWQYNIK